jgi:1-acylglycerone phosphate reductase
MYSTNKVIKQSETTDRFIYAENVVAQSLKSTSPAWFWYGINTATVRLIDMFAWRTIWVSLPQLSWFICFLA